MDKELNIFLLIGQSNMAGRGNMDEVPELKHPQIFMFRDGQWVKAVEPLHTDKPRIAGVGLGMSFANHLIEEAGLVPIGFVPCAVGGTPLSRWMPGADLYENAVEIAKSALDHGILKGILWHQGEGDSNSLEDAESYGDRFSKMIESLRSEFSAESVPVISGELGRFLEKRDGCNYFKLVNKKLNELENKIPNYACTSSEGLNDKGDNLHFNAASLREFGVRYSEKFLEINMA